MMVHLCMQMQVELFMQKKKDLRVGTEKMKPSSRNM
jgi:hypothetical protein